MKGGSVASKHVEKFIQQTGAVTKNKLPGGNNIKGFRPHQVASGRRMKRKSKKKSGKKRKNRRSKKKSKGGSPLSSLSKKITQIRYGSHKQNPGKFPKKSNNKINWLKKSPRIIGGKKNKRGGSDWKSTLYSFSANKGYGKHSKKFTKLNSYVQNPPKIHSGRMFKPFHKPIKTFNNRTKINNFRMAQNIFDKIRNINKSPMFLPLLDRSRPTAGTTAG